MARSRRSRGFSPLGSLGPDRLGLPERQRRQLTLAHAWRRVAGQPIGRRTCRIALRRGVLDVTLDDKSWVQTLGELAPELVARLAAAHPELGIRRFRVRWEGDSGPAAPSIPLPAVEASPPPSGRPETAPAPVARAACAPADPIDPRRVMERYLRRCEGRRTQKP